MSRPALKVFLGHAITEPWWLRVEEMLAAGHTSDASVPDAYMRESARRNREGIVEADALVALCRAEGGLSSGTAYEIGYADDRVGDVLIVGDPRKSVAAYGDRVSIVPDMTAALWWIAGRE